MEEAIKRMKKSEYDLEEAKQEQVKLFTQNRELEKKMDQMTESFHLKLALKEDEIQELKSSHEQYTQDMEAKLKHSSEGYERASREIQQLLTEQKNLSEKW